MSARSRGRTLLLGGIGVFLAVTAAGSAWYIFSVSKPLPGASNASRDGAVTFSEDVAPIVFAQCVPCHRPGEAGPFSLLSFAQVRKRARQIVEVTQSRYMPPWKPEPGHGELIGVRRLDDREIETIKEWLEDGAVEGDSALLPPVPAFQDGWQLGEPDLVVELERPYVLPADGRDVFRNFVMELPVSTTRFVKAVELRPGNPRVVHHGLIKIDRTGASRRRDGQDVGPGFSGMDMGAARDPDGHFLVWTPGATPAEDPPGMSWKLERGTDVVVQLHLRPSGKPEKIQPRVGLFFTDEPPRIVPTVLQLYSLDIDIPAGAAAYVVEDSFVLSVDVDVLDVFPHAHYLGKDVQAYAILPGGGQRWLLRITDWDFNWQDCYRYRKPISLPKGSTLWMRYTYDNSEDNSRNPSSPPVRVKAGDESTDEMGSLTLRVLTRGVAERLKLEEMVERRRLQRNPTGNWDAHFGLGAVLQLQGRLEEASAEYRQSLRYNPENARAHSNLGTVLRRRNEIPEAMRHYRRAIEIMPGLTEAHVNYGNALKSLGQLEAAVGRYREALRIDRDSAGAHYNLGVALREKLELSEAAVHFRRALEIEPDRPGTLSHLAWILATHEDAAMRNGEEAVRFAERASRLTGSRHPTALRTLAAAYAEAGRFDDAERAAEQSIEHAGRVGKKDLATQTARELELYRQRQPLRTRVESK